MEYQLGTQILIGVLFFDIIKKKYRITGVM